MEEINIDTWEHFIQQIDELRRECNNSADHVPGSGLLFRGQENSCWPLSTTLDRKQLRISFQDYFGVISRIKSQIESLTDQEWVIPQPPEIESLVKDYDKFSRELRAGERPWYAYMTYLRHHGFPSPLLDWTRSLYVAAYFAFGKASEAANGRVSIYAYSARNFRISGNNMRVLYRFGPHVKTHRRHVLQQSQYTMCIESTDESRFESHDAVFVAGLHQQGVCWKFTIPSNERTRVLKLLDDHNLNAFSLFGSEESLMETLAIREFCFGPTQGGQS